MDAYKDARPTQRRWTAAPAGSQCHSLIESTKYKLADMRLSALYGMDEIEAGAVTLAHELSTLRCGAYLAHARLDLTFDEIRHILAVAGGDADIIDGMEQHLHDWRYRGGYTEEEAAAAKKRAEVHKKGGK